ncbi:MAG TPA: hypothetical protein DCM05_03805, partial [Elusimicrobia bacterium]|nr:hypothetical protein [Elusimicrobiota bacterium]
MKSPSLQVLALALLTLGAGFWGLGWTLPSKQRLAWLLPAGLDNPEFHKSLQESWRKMHESLGENLMIASQELTSFQGLQQVPGGWKEPPPLLVNCVRSFYLRSAHDDEQTFLILFSKMRPKQLDFRPRMYLYGGGYLYPLGAWMGGFALLGVGHLSRELTAYFARPDWLAGLYLSGRLFSVFAWLGVVLLAWRLGRRLIGECCGFGAALVCALSPGAMVQTHVMKQHTLWPLWALACFGVCLRILEGGSQHSGPQQPRWLTSGPLRNYLLAGALAGLAAGTFTLAALVCLFPAAAALLRVLRRGADWKVEAKGLAAAAAAAVLAFFVVNPYWLADIPTVRAELATQAGYSAFHA